MITAETVSSIRHFDSGGLPVVSLYARVDSGPDGQREVRTRVSSLLDEIRPLAKDGIADIGAGLRFPLPEPPAEGC